MKSEVSPELPSKMASTQTKIKPDIVALYNKYEPALKTLGEIINIAAKETVALSHKGIDALLSWTVTEYTLGTDELLESFEKAIIGDDDMFSSITQSSNTQSSNDKKIPLRLKLDNEYAEMAVEAFKAISEGKEYKPVDFKGNWPHLNQESSCPYKILHAMSSGQQGNHLYEIIEYYCFGNPVLKAQLITFVDALNKALEPFVQELHKIVNVCKVSYDERAKEIVLEFTSSKIAKWQYKSGKFAPESSPVKLENNCIKIPSKDGKCIVFDSLAEVGTFLPLFKNSSIASKSDVNPKTVYFTNKDGNSNLPDQFCINNDVDLCGDWNISTQSDIYQ